jgi:hypothetical protein
MKRLVVGLLSAVFLLSAASVDARLGEKKKKAQAREKTWQKKFGATDPYFRTDDNDIVIQECWSGPEVGWSERKALKFAIQLVPRKLWKKKPKRGKPEGTTIVYKYPDGTGIVLSEGPQGFIQVEVYLPRYKGRRC